MTVFDIVRLTDNLSGLLLLAKLAYVKDIVCAVRLDGVGWGVQW